MRTKKTLAILIVFVMLSAMLTVGVNAAGMSVMWVQTSETGNELTVDGSQLTAQAYTFGYFGVDSCYVIAVLQKRVNGSWSNYETWSAYSSSSWPDVAALSEAVTVSSGSYRLVTYHGVTDNGYTEAHTMYSPTRIVS